MKRKELTAYDKWLTRRKWRTGEIISPEKAADLYLAEHPLPPAEGAEQEKILTDFAEKMNTAMVNNDPEFEQIVNDHYFDLIEQPTAEGAEEILVKHGFFIMAHKDSNEEVRKAFIEPVLAAMQEFATLHAQKIADKMVSDRLREELGLYNDWLNGAAGKYLTNPFIDEYLKSEYYLKSREEKK
jgi:hypothetical protein